VAELADAQVSKTCARKTGLRVQLPLLAQMPNRRLPALKFSWTPELAYAVGLITTDGSLSKDKRHITFTSTDLDLIKTFKKCLKLAVKITKNPQSFSTNRQCFRVQFGNVRFYDWLVKIGLGSNKTFKLTSLYIPDNYFPDFVRGHLDGDGSIITYIDRYLVTKNPKYIYKRLMVYLMSASRPHVDWLQEKIIKLTNLHGAIQVKKHRLRKNSIYVLKFSKKESILLLKWIYYKRGLSCLKRKYDKAKEFLSLT
jgi:hypothetical protein